MGYGQCDGTAGHTKELASFYESLVSKTEAKNAELAAALAQERARGERLAHALSRAIAGLQEQPDVAQQTVVRWALVVLARALEGSEPVFIGGADIDWSQIPPGPPGSITIEPAPASSAEPADPTTAATAAQASPKAQGE